MEKIKKDSVSDIVFNRLSQLIISGDWKQGYRLPPEKDLAKELGVSRVSVRSAIQKLQTFGMVTTQAGDGTFVNQVNMTLFFKQLYNINAIPHDHKQMNEVKSAIEECCLMICIEKKQSKKDIEKLNKTLSIMLEYLKNDDMNNYLSVDLDFHKTIVKMTGNEVLIMIYEAISSLIYDESKWNTLRGAAVNKETHLEVIRRLHQDSIDVLTTHDKNKCISIYYEQQNEANKLYEK